MTLKMQLAAMIEEADRRPISATNGDDWWQLSDAEEEVFAIDRARFVRMSYALYCYDGFKLIAEAEWDDVLIQQARAERPEWCGEGIDIGEFTAFAKEYAGLTSREAHAIYIKQQFWRVRAGLVRYPEYSQT